MAKVNNYGKNCAYVTDNTGRKHVVEFISSIVNNKVTYYVDYAIHESKVYYRHERTWDDHMGNTPCGYYVVAPINRRERCRVYLHQC